jgi:hypothetical protein
MGLWEYTVYPASQGRNMFIVVEYVLILGYTALTLVKAQIESIPLYITCSYNSEQMGTSGQSS